MTIDDLALRLRGGRFATQDDLDELVALERECFPTRPPRRPLSFLLYPTIIVVDVDAGELLGYGSMSIAQSVAFLWDSAVAPHARRRGLASALLAERMRLAILMGCQILTGGLAAENTAMRKLHEDTGWTIEYKPTDGLATPIPVHTWSTNPVTLAWLTRQYEENPWLTTPHPRWVTELLPGARLLNPDANRSEGLRLRYRDEVWMLDDRDTSRAQTKWVTLPTAIEFDWAAYRRAGVIRRMPRATWDRVSRPSTKAPARYVLEYDRAWDLFELAQDQPRLEGVR